MALGWFREFLFEYILRSDWVIRSTRRSLQRLVINMLELDISYFASKSLKRSFSLENFTLMSFLKFSRLRTSSISFLTSFPTDFLFVPFLIIINWMTRYNLGKNGNGCKMMLTLQRSYKKKSFFWRKSFSNQKMKLYTAQMMTCDI